jgi:hypothetical protein
MVKVEMMMVSLILIGGLPAHTEIDMGRPLAWPLVLGFLAILLGSVSLWARHELPRRLATNQARIT